jgi:DNA-binding CsgD family transcriptional regulator
LALYRIASPIRDRNDLVPELWRALGELETADHNFTAAEYHLLKSLSLAENCAAPFERALTLLTVAELRAAQKNYVEARSLLDAVRSICESISAQPALTRAESLKMRISGRGWAMEAPAGLTPRECEVLRFVARGMTDREIADALFISHHTVARHVSHILNKLDVDSRTAAATCAVRNGVV